MAYTINHYITDWVEESRALMQPDKVLWIDGTETQLEELRREAYITGELIKLNQEKLPGCVYHRSALNDVARVDVEKPRLAVRGSGDVAPAEVDFRGFESRLACLYLPLVYFDFRDEGVESLLVYVVVLCEGAVALHL